MYILELMYLRGFLGVYLRLTDRLLSPDRHFVFSSIMSKTRIRFLLNHLGFENGEERRKIWKIDGFVALRQIWELSKSNVNKYV